VVGITATPNLGYSFQGWTGNVAGQTISTTVTMSQPQTVTAEFNFAAQRCDLNLNTQLDLPDMRNIIDQALGVLSPSADLIPDGWINVADVQTMANVLLGLGTCPH